MFERNSFLVRCWAFGTFAAWILPIAVGAYTRDYCNKVQFNFKDPRSALADFRACSDLEPRKHPTELKHKFATGWAKFALETGVEEALQALNNKEVRRILIPSEEWNGIVSRYRASIGDSDTSKTVSKVQILIVVILVVQIMVIAYLVRIASDVGESLSVNFDILTRQDSCQ